MVSGNRKLDEILKKHGYDYKWISGDDIIVSNWVRMKCMFGCSGYGAKATCPPEVPSVEECRKFFSEYKKAVIIHFPVKVANDNKRRGWARKSNSELLELERSVFLAGYQKAFVLTSGSCYICAECPGNRIDCIDKEGARPTPEAFGVDVFATARNCGYPIQVLSDYGQTQHRYALLMVE